MRDYLVFRRLITPIIIQIVFWIAVVAVVIAGVVRLVTAADSREVVAGLLLIVLGPIGVRVYAELLIVLFGIHNRLDEVTDLLTEIRNEVRRPSV